MSIPVPNFDKWFFHENGELSEYLVVDSRYTSFCRGEGKDGYTQSRSIMAKKQKGHIRVGLAAVLTDGTRSMNRPIVEISYDDVPKDIKKIWKQELVKIRTFCEEEDEAYWKQAGIDYWNV